MAVQYAFGWRPSLPDINDIRYAAPLQTLRALPPSIDLSQPALPAPFEPALNQGNLGSCGPNSLAGLIAFLQVKDPGWPDYPASRLFLYYNTRSLMGTINSDSGVNNRDMLKAFARWGWPHEDVWPYSINQFRTKPTNAAYVLAAANIPNIQYQNVPQSLEQMKGCLVATGKPFIFGFTVYANMLSPQVDASGDIPMPSGGVQGGHDILVVGYDDATQRFKIKNSWGSWGRSGYGTIPYSYAINAQLAGDFWTVTQVEPLPTPAPPDPIPVPPGPPQPPVGAGKLKVTMAADSLSARIEIVA